jgi:hypothetical protein
VPSSFRGEESSWPFFQAFISLTKESRDQERLGIRVP